MKNTNKKTLLIEIISLILVVGLIGGGVALISNGLKKAENVLDDAFGDFQGMETSLSTDTGTSTETTVPSEDTKLTYAEGEVICGCRTQNNFSGYSVCANNLKANTKYRVFWSFDSTFETYGFYIYYYNDDNVSKPCISFSTSPSFTGAQLLKASSESELLTNNYEITTDENGYIELMLLRSDVTESDALSAKLSAFEELINYVEIEEVTE